MIRLALILAAVFAGPLRAGDLAEHVPWIGVGLQDNGSHWSIRLTPAPSGEAARISYPSLACSGVLEPVPSEPDTFREQILVGTENCIASGIVTLTDRPDGLLDYAWREPGGPVGSRAVLRPAGIAPTPYGNLLRDTVTKSDLRFLVLPPVD